MQKLQLLTRQSAHQQFEQELLLELSEQERKSWDHWKQRLRRRKAWLAMLSKQYRTGKVRIDRVLARQNAKRFGEAINRYVEWEIEDYARERAYVDHAGFSEEKTCVVIGVGTGLGMQHLHLALAENMRLQVIDWVSEALAYGEAILQPMLEKTLWHPQDILKLGEAKRECSRLTPAVAIVEMARVIEHMPESDAAETIKGAGQILADPENRAVFVDALSGEKNQRVETETCTHYPLGFFLENASQGAGRPVRLYRSRTFEDIEKVFTAFTIRSER